MQHTSRITENAEAARGKQRERIQRRVLKQIYFMNEWRQVERH